MKKYILVTILGMGINVERSEAKPGDNNRQQRQENRIQQGVNSSELNKRESGGRPNRPMNEGSQGEGQGEFKSPRPPKGSAEYERDIRKIRQQIHEGQMKDRGNEQAPPSQENE